jgi:hypothetical protein
MTESKSNKIMPIVKIKDSINKDIIDFHELSTQRQFIDIIEQYIDEDETYISWYFVASNPNAIHLIEKYLKENIPEDYFWHNLSANPNAYDILMKNVDKIKWDNLSANPNACDILIKNVDKIDWANLATNPNITYIYTNLMIQKKKLIHEYLDTLDDNTIIDLTHINNLYNFGDEFIFNLSSNPNAIHILEKISGDTFDDLSWDGLSENLNAINIIKKYKDKIRWSTLSSNPNAIALIEEQLEIQNKDHLPKRRKIDDPNDINLTKKFWKNLSSNINAIRIIEKNLDKINWVHLSSNLNAINLIGKNLDKIDWYKLSLNPNAIAFFDNINFENLNGKELFNYLNEIKYVVKVNDMYEASFIIEYFLPMTEFNRYRNVKKIPKLRGHFLNNIFEVDYEFLKARMNSTIGEELIKVMFHPKNINKFKSWGFDFDSEIE